MSSHGLEVPRPLLTRVTRGLAGTYEVQQVLGAGRMSAVFRARDLRLQRPVAVRVLWPDLAAGIVCDRFLRAVRLEAPPRHPGIVPLLEAGVADGLPFLVTPFIEGESLEARLERTPRLALEEALRITGGVAVALAAAHEKGVLHRDLKPTSILLGKDTIAVADFGLARALDESGAGCFTTAGLAVGTPEYMSPERGLAEVELDPSSDQYSLACVLHRMLAGEPPFTARSSRALLYTHTAREPPRIRDSRPEIPWAVECVLLRALSKSPAERFPTVTGFAAALEKAASDEEPRRGLAQREGGNGWTLSDPRDSLSARLTRALIDHPGRLTLAVLAFGVLLVIVSILVTLWFLTPGGAR